MGERGDMDRVGERGGVKEGERGREEGRDDDRPTHPKINNTIIQTSILIHSTMKSLLHENDVIIM